MSWLSSSLKDISAELALYEGCVDCTLLRQTALITRRNLLQCPVDAEAMFRVLRCKQEDELLIGF